MAFPSDSDLVSLAQQMGQSWVTSGDAYWLRMLTVLLFTETVMTLGLLAFGLASLAKKLEQKVYDVEALDLYNEIVEGHQKVFSVYLRPFYITNKLFESSRSLRVGIEELSELLRTQTRAARLMEFIGAAIDHRPTV
jgi:hypothetical protein